MTITDTIILATAAIAQPGLGSVPERTLLVGAATLTVRQRFGAYGLELDAHSTSSTDDPELTVAWLAERLVGSARLLVWQAEHIVVPSLIAACDTARDTLAAARLLRELDRAMDGDVVDIAGSYGGTRAVSFDAVAHDHDLPFVPLKPADLKQAFQTGNRGVIRRHLTTRATSAWRLWLRTQRDAETAIAATDAWIDQQPDASARTAAA